MTERAAAPAAAPSSIDPAEVAKFQAMAAEWWDPHGKFAPLHKFNPVRLSFIRDKALALGFDAVGFAPARLAPDARRQLAALRRQFNQLAWPRP